MNVCKSINGRKLNGPLGGKIGKSSCLNFLTINQCDSPSIQPVKYRKVKMLIAQLCPAPCDPMDYSSPVSSDHGIFLEGMVK